VLLAGQFGDRTIPAWANEGIAVLSESPEGAQRHLRELPRYRKEGQLWRPQELIALEIPPEPRYLGPFYAQSASLVAFPADEQGADTFIRCLREGLGRGYETSLQKHYGWTFADLERRWQQHAFGPIPTSRPPR